MKVTLKEMNGLLNGKCLPSDLIVGETLAEYLVRKFDDLEQKLAESQREFRAADATIENLQMQVTVPELHELNQNKGSSDLDFERACPDYLICDLCGHDAHHCGGGNYECSEGHLFSVSERLFGSRIVPAGWVAVPASPTGDMLARIRLSDTWTTEALTARYKDMIHAAPRAPYVSFGSLLRKGVQS